VGEDDAGPTLEPKDMVLKSSLHAKNSYKWWVLVTVATGSVSVTLDNSILATSLPQLAAVFHVDASLISWVNLAYFVTSQSLVLTIQLIAARAIQGIGAGAGVSLSMAIAVAAFPPEERCLPPGHGVVGLHASEQ
jgi:MFS family permease